MSRPRLCAMGVTLVTVVALAYTASLRGGFLWDDDLRITANPTIVGPLWSKVIWTTSLAYDFSRRLSLFVQGRNVTNVKDPLDAVSSGRAGRPARLPPADGGIRRQLGLRRQGHVLKRNTGRFVLSAVGLAACAFFRMCAGHLCVCCRHSSAATFRRRSLGGMPNPKTCLNVARRSGQTNSPYDDPIAFPPFAPSGKCRVRRILFAGIQACRAGADSFDRFDSGPCLQPGFPRIRQQRRGTTQGHEPSHLH